jgi:hypothetical protein
MNVSYQTKAFPATAPFTSRPQCPSIDVKLIAALSEMQARESSVLSEKYVA